MKLAVLAIVMYLMFVLAVGAVILAAWIAFIKWAVDFQFPGWLVF